MLYQPKNDDVLFTFFGVSKRIRQRSLSAEVRRKLVVKRKAQRLLQSFGLEVLVRDASGQKEMLMPIAGKKPAKEAAPKKPAAKPQRKSA